MSPASPVQKTPMAAFTVQIICSSLRELYDALGLETLNAWSLISLINNTLFLNGPAVTPNPRTFPQLV